METDTTQKKQSLKKITTITQSPREWELVETNPDKMIEQVSQNHLFKELSLKQYVGNLRIAVKSGKSKLSFVIDFSEQISIPSNNEIVLFKYVREKYFELLFERVSSTNKTHTCNLRQVKIAKQTRRTERFSTEKNPVHGGNFLVAKIDLDIKTALSFSTEVIFNEVDKTLKIKYPRSKIVPIFNRHNLTEEEILVRDEKLPIVIANTIRMESSKELKTINLKKFYEEEMLLEEKIKTLRKEMIQSFIYYPIIFKSPKEDVVIGYCYNESQTSPISQGNIEYFEIIAYTIKKRIMDSSTAVVDEKQNILNISEHGLLLEVTSEYIQRALQSKPTFSMDIVFKMMVPMRFSLYTKHIYKIDNTFYIGAEITGSNNDEKGFDKYKDIVRAFK